MVNNCDVSVFVRSSMINSAFPSFNDVLFGSGFSDSACKILRAVKTPFEAVNVLTDQTMRAGIKEFSAWPTIPQLYVQGEFVGGSDIMLEMYKSGELAKLIANVDSEKSVTEDHIERSSNGEASICGMSDGHDRKGGVNGREEGDGGVSTDSRDK